MTPPLFQREPAGWLSFLRGFRHAARGLRFLAQTQQNARIHLIVSLCVVAAGFVLSVSPLEWCALLFAMAIVMVTETLNTAVEGIVDMLSPAIHPQAGRIKDLAAAAVLLASVAAAIVGCVIFLPKLLQHF